MSASKIRLLISDVDGTLVTSDKLLTTATIEAVKELRRAGIIFAITSSRPPRGLSVFVEPLHLSTPLSAFNGGVVVDPDLRIVAERTVPDDLVQPTIRLLDDHGLSVWVYQGEQWFVRDPHGPHIQHESTAVQFEPTSVPSFDSLATDVAKIVGVSDSAEAMAAARQAIEGAFAQQVAASSSQSYYLDVTHPLANKGTVVDFLSKQFDIPPSEIAVIGDGQNDVMMFDRAGFSIAMGNGDREVQRAAHVVTDTNDAEGFSSAVTNYVLD
jgi:Cof subfamily protein (haloacid dehalogenase superfamily)